MFCYICINMSRYHWSEIKINCFTLENYIFIAHEHVPSSLSCTSYEYFMKCEEPLNCKSCVDKVNSIMYQLKIKLIINVC